MREVDINAIKKFLEEKIAELKKELEFYEYLIAMIEFGGYRVSKKETGKEVIEIKCNKKPIAIIEVFGGKVVLKPLFNLKYSSEFEDILKKQLGFLSDKLSLEINYDNDKRSIKSLVINGLGGGVVREGVIEILRNIVVDEYKS